MSEKIGFNVGFVRVYNVLLIVIMAFSFIMIGCSGSKSEPPTSGGDGNNGAVYLGEIMKTNGQLYVANIAVNGVRYSKLTGYSGLVHQYYSDDVAVGLINDGKLLCVIEPSMIMFFYPEDMSWLIFEDYSHAHTQISKDVDFGVVDLFMTPDFYIHRAYYSNVKMTPYVSFVQELVQYVYVEEDIVVSGQKFTDDYDFTRNAFSFTLRGGWNTVYKKIEFTGDAYAVSIDLKNPDHVVWLCVSREAEEDAQISNPEVINSLDSFWKNRKLRFEEAMNNRNSQIGK